VPEHAKREAIKCGDHGRLGSSTGCARGVLVDLDIVCHKACHGSRHGSHTVRSLPGSSVGQDGFVSREKATRADVGRLETAY
jgi:hypothetical protein